MNYNRSSEFISRHIGPSDSDQAKMLASVGYSSIDQFINTEKPIIRRVHKTSYNDRPFCIISRTSGCAYLFEGKSLMATSYA